MGRWPGVWTLIGPSSSMEKEVGECVASCEVCACNKVSRHPPPGHPLPVTHRPWLFIYLDFVTGLPPSRGNTTIFMVVNRLFRMVHFIPLPILLSTKQTWEVMPCHVFHLHGFPRDVVSDLGSKLISHFWKGILLYAWGQYQPLLWLPPPVQRCVSVPHLWEQTPHLGGTCTQHPALLFLWCLTLPVHLWLPSPLFAKVEPEVPCSASPHPVLPTDLEWGLAVSSSEHRLMTDNGGPMTGAGPLLPSGTKSLALHTVISS